MFTEREKTSSSELDQLFEEVGKYNSVTDVLQLYDFVKRFPFLKPYNAMMIHLQRPGSLSVMTAKNWRERFNRVIKPSANPLIILRPFGPIDIVWEVSDTDHDPENEIIELPTIIEKPFATDGTIPPGTLQLIVENALCDGIVVDEEKFGALYAGQAAYYPNTKQFNRGNSIITYTIETLFQIACNNSHSETDKCNTVFHELAHIYSGHVECDTDKSPILGYHFYQIESEVNRSKKEKSYVKEKKFLTDRRWLSTEAKEFEAESVAWLICNRFGIKTSAVEYLSGYTVNNAIPDNVSIESILRVSGYIESMCREKLSVRKELVIEKRSNTLR
jgi:hypothetical protein